MYIAVDIGATWTRIALCNSRDIIEKVSFRTPRTGNEYTIALEIVREVRNKWSRELGRIKAIGVATIGPIDIRTGSVVNTPNNPIRNFEILRPLARELGRPVYVANDCVASVWGEKNYGDGERYDNLIYLTLSTGVGAGIIVDGELLIGKQGNAHEIGHLIVDFDSEIRCGCGGRGHWEAYAGGANLPRVAMHLLEKDKSMSNTDLGRLILSGTDLDSKTIFSLYRNGDLLAKRVVELFIKASAAGIASMINAYDPELITIGGGIFLNNIDVLYDPIIKLVQENIVTGMPEIKPTKLGEDIGIYGALAIASNTPSKLREIQDIVNSKILGYPS